MLTIISFLFVLSLLVIVHEFGHYAVAKLAGIRVERFSVGMPPKLLGLRIGETDYCISAIPFGGYVKLTGQSDFDEVEECDSYSARDYRGKSATVKVSVLAAGSLMNLFTAVIIFFFLYWFTGVPESTNRIGFVEPDTLAAQVGLRMGDEIVAIDDSPVKSLQKVLLGLYTSESSTLLVKDSTGERTIHIPRKLEGDEQFGVIEYLEARIGAVLPGSPAEKAGFQPGDVITAIGEEKIVGWSNMRMVVEANPDAEKIFTVDRGGEKIQLDVTIGHALQDRPDGSQVTVGRVGYYVRVSNRDVGFFESARMAVDNTVFIIVHTIDFFIKLVTGRMSAKLLGGPVMIARMAGESAKSGFATLLGFTAFISINLGVLNLLPFPVLDGGHIVILLIETIVRRKLSHKTRMAFQQAGTLVLLLFMLYITFNDIMRIESISRLFGN